MATMFRGGLSDWIRGAQSIVHEWRMLSESIIQTLFAGLVILVALVTLFAWRGMTDNERHSLVVYGRASVNIVVLGDPTKLVAYREPEGQVWLIRSDKFTQSQLADDAKAAMFQGGRRGFLIGVGAMTTIIFLVGAFFYFTGRSQSTDDHVRGAVRGTVKSLKRALRRHGPRGVLTLGKVWVPREFETQHMQFIGASGTGKTQAILRLLDGVRLEGQRAVVYDINGAFVEKFYRPDRDVLLNPLDARAPSWNIWAEVQEQTDYDRLAASLLPEDSFSEPFWVNAGRAVFASVAEKLAKEAAKRNQKPRNEDLVKMLTLEPMSRFISFCRNTQAMSFIDEGGEKMTASVRATIASNMKGFRYIEDEGDLFSISDYIADDNPDRWLFITSKNKQLDAFRGLITLWVDTATATLLSMTEDPDRRMWLVFDELPSLNRLTALPQMMAQSRKFGGCAALGYQSFARLVSVYRREEAEAIAGNCSTSCLFRPNDPMTAEWCSQSLGKAEREEAQEGVSVGRHEMRDGRTMQKQKVERAVVLPSELRNLDNLNFFLSMGRGLPIVQHKFRYRKFRSVAKAFVQSAQKIMLADWSDEPDPVETEETDQADGASPAEADGDDAQAPETGKPEEGGEKQNAEHDRPKAPPGKPDEKEHFGSGIERTGGGDDEDGADDERTIFERMQDADHDAPAQGA